MKPSSESTPTIVLDTNVVLDWLLFADPSCDGIRRGVVGGKIRWIATAAMRDELMQVLDRRSLAAWQPDSPALLAVWERNCIELPTPAVSIHSHECLCSDTDDQKFIDLALSSGARWLLSRDRAVLKLARKMHARGVEVIKPDAWNMVDG